MKSLFNLSHLFGRTRLDPDGSSPATTLISRGAELADVPQTQAVEIVFLLDSPKVVDVQHTLAAVDALSWFSRSVTPLYVSVIHREDPDAGTLAIFDSAPGLSFRHIGFDAVAGQEAAGAALNHYWRDYTTLVYARYCRAAFYLVLDPSCICIRPFDVEALIESGRVITQWEPPTLHPECMAGAQDLLQAAVAPDSGLSTLPAVLSTALVMRTLQRLEAAQSTRAEQVLLKAAVEDKAWSANALYNCASAFALADYHRPPVVGELTKALHSDINVWDDSTDLSSWEPARWIQLATHGQFLVAKSSDAKRSREMLGKCYGLLAPH